MGPVWDADGEKIVNETFTRLEKAFHAIFSERDAVASNLLRASGHIVLGLERHWARLRRRETPKQIGDHRNHRLTAVGENARRLERQLA